MYLGDCYSMCSAAYVFTQNYVLCVYAYVCMCACVFACVHTQQLLSVYRIKHLIQKRNIGTIRKEGPFNDTCV